MMTIEERDTARAIQSIARSLRKPKDIDWEQRRYEIAKEVICGAYVVDQLPEKAANDAVEYADALIAILRTKPNKAE